MINEYYRINDTKYSLEYESYQVYLRSAVYTYMIEILGMLSLLMIFILANKSFHSLIYVILLVTQIIFMFVFELLFIFFVYKLWDILTDKKKVGYCIFILGNLVLGIYLSVLLDKIKRVRWKNIFFRKILIYIIHG